MQLRSPETIPEDIVSAFREAELERRPVVLNIPADFQWQDVEFRPPQRRPVIRQSVRPSEDALDAALGHHRLVASPARAGRPRATSAAARAAVLGFARRIGAPVTTTLQARELFAGEPEDLGIFGTLSTDTAVDVIGQADCVVAFGAALNRWTTGEGSLLNGPRVRAGRPRPGRAQPPSHRGRAGRSATRPWSRTEFVRLLDEVVVHADRASPRVRAQRSSTGPETGPPEAGRAPSRGRSTSMKRSARSTAPSRPSAAWCSTPGGSSTMRRSTCAPER